MHWSNWSLAVSHRIIMILHTTMTAPEHKSNFKLPKDTPYLTLTGELWGVCCDNFGANQLRYNHIALYLVIISKLSTTGVNTVQPM